MQPHVALQAYLFGTKLTLKRNIWDYVIVIILIVTVSTIYDYLLLPFITSY